MNEHRMKFEKLFDRIESVRLEKVTKKYGERFAVKELDLEVRGGELLILIGPSGSGKTTALRTINRLVEPDSGKVLINGTDVSGLDPVRLRRNTGYVIQNIGLLPHLRVSENIGLVLKLEGLRKEKIRERVRELLEFVSLPPESFMDRYPHQLSGGQQQRVGLARALALDPPLLLMDEPFGALDPLLRGQLQNEFLRIKKELGRTILFVTHDINEAFKLGDRVGIMDSAELVQVGTPEELIFSPANELVAEIVDAKRRYRHIEALKVRDLMQPLDSGYVLEEGLSVEEALGKMSERKLEIALVFENSALAGRISVNALLRAKAEGNDLTLRDCAEPLYVFDSEAPLYEALAELKEGGKTGSAGTGAGLGGGRGKTSAPPPMALVLEGHRPSGLLFPDRVLLDLI